MKRIRLRGSTGVGCYPGPQDGKKWHRPDSIVHFFQTLSCLPQIPPKEIGSGRLAKVRLMLPSEWTPQIISSAICVFAGWKGTFRTFSWRAIFSRNIISINSARVLMAKLRWRFNSICKLQNSVSKLYKLRAGYKAMQALELGIQAMQVLELGIQAMHSCAAPVRDRYNEEMGKQSSHPLPASIDRTHHTRVCSQAWRHRYSGHQSTGQTHRVPPNVSNLQLPSR